MIINIWKTKTIILSRREGTHTIILNEQWIEQVKNFNYLGIIIEDIGKRSKEIDKQLGRTVRLYKIMKKNFLRRNFEECDNRSGKKGS